MVEMTWTTMHIGGSLPASKIDELIALFDVFSDAQEKPDDEAELRDNIAANKSLLIQGQVNYGNPDELIEFCKDNKLAFWLHFDAGYEWDPGIQVWHPDFPAIIECAASGQGYAPVIELAMLKENLKNGSTLADVVGGLQVYTSEHCPPMTIIEDAKEEA
jgi:hypothetical protein